MKIIVPTTITDAMIVSSSVAEPDTALAETAWSATEINADGDERYVGAPSATVSISNGSPAVITWTAYGQAVDTPIVFENTGGALPTGLTEGVTYYLRSRLTVDTFTVSAKKGGRPVSTTSAGSGTHTATAYVHKMYEAIAGQRAAVTFTNATNKVNDAAHGLAENTAIVFTNSGGGLPPELTAGTTYYIRSPGVNDYEVSATSGGSSINISTDGTGTHTRGLALNYNKPPAISPDVWEHVGSTNKYAVFDRQGGTVTTADEELEYVLTPGRFNAFLIRQLDAQSVEISVDLPGSPPENVYTYSIDLSNGTTVGDWYQYIYSPIYLMDTASDTEIVDAAILELPAFSDAILTITISRPGGQVQAGTIIVGMSQQIGEMAVDELSLEIIDESEKETDSRGNTTLEEGPYRDTEDVQVLVDLEDFDSVKKIMTTYRATAIVWLPAPGVYDSASLYGFTRRWRLTKRDGHALLTATIESL